MWQMCLRTRLEISPGDRVFLIYEHADELPDLAVPFIKDGLAKKECCVYVADDPPVRTTNALAERGVDVDREAKRGALMLLSRPAHSAPPPSGAAKMMERILRSVRAADGFAGVRLALELTPAGGMEIGNDLLVQHNSLFDVTCVPGTLTSVCMYRRNRFHPSTLHDLVHSRTKVVAGDDVYLNLCALFQGLDRAGRDVLLQSARARRVRRGEFFFHQGDRADHVYVLTRGMVKLVRTDPEGRSVIPHIALPSEPFGHVSILGGETQLIAAQALEDARALVWDASTIRHMITRHPSVSSNVVRLMTERVVESWNYAHDVATERSDRRIGRLLLQLAQTVGRTAQTRNAVELSLSHQDLAEMASTTQFTVSRVLSGWKRQNIVDVGRERIVVLDRQRLRAAVGARS